MRRSGSIQLKPMDGYLAGINSRERRTNHDHPQNTFPPDTIRNIRITGLNIVSEGICAARLWSLGHCIIHLVIINRLQRKKRPTVCTQGVINPKNLNSSKAKSNKVSSDIAIPTGNTTTAINSCRHKAGKGVGYCSFNSIETMAGNG